MTNAAAIGPPGEAGGEPANADLQARFGRTEPEEAAQSPASR
jgi:hypothetical protein